MKKIDLVREAIARLGAVPSAELAAHIFANHAVQLSPPVVAILRASVQELESLQQFRIVAREKVEQALGRPLQTA